MNFCSLLNSANKFIFFCWPPRLAPCYQSVMEWAFRHLEFYCTKSSSWCTMQSARIRLSSESERAVALESKVERLSSRMALSTDVYVTLSRWWEFSLRLQICFATDVTSNCFNFWRFFTSINRRFLVKLFNDQQSWTKAWLKNWKLSLQHRMVTTRLLERRCARPIFTKNKAV